MRNISIAHVLHRPDEFLKEKSQDQILTKWLQKALIHFSSMMEKIQTGFVKVRKSLWSVGSEQNANQPTSVCGKELVIVGTIGLS